MLTSLRAPVRDLSQVGEARRAVAALCSGFGENETFCGRVALVVTELARNLVLHGGGGEIVFRELSHPKHSGLEILSLDAGPGMQNVGECLRDGYSTAGTPGTGLGAVRRLSDFFDVSTVTGRGTVICARLYPEGARAPEACRIGAVSVALAGEELCGDSWSVLETPSSMKVLLADGLGHGAFAAEASREAVAVFRAHPHHSPAETLPLLHDALRKTRGAAITIVDLQYDRKELTMVGAGNVTARIFDAAGKSRQMAGANGTVGANLPKIHPVTVPWAAGGVLVLQSDGLSTRWNADPYPGLLQRHPAVIAGVIFRDFSRASDDATIVAITPPS